MAKTDNFFATKLFFGETVFTFLHILFDIMNIFHSGYEQCIKHANWIVGGCVVAIALQSVWWPWLFRRCLPIQRRMLIIGCAGGSGKSTLARTLHTFYDFAHIGLDECKFGPAWKRFSAEEFCQRLHSKIALANGGPFVIEGTFHDPKLPEQRDVCASLCGASSATQHSDVIVDVVVWNDIPFVICLWRKLFRSVKRAIGIEAQGAAPETLRNVFEMAKKTASQFYVRHNDLSAFWHALSAAPEQPNPVILCRAHWPFYYDVCL